jgi:hypothetical protein
MRGPFDRNARSMNWSLNLAVYVSSECSQQLHQLVSTCPATSHPSCHRLQWLAQTQKQNRQQNRGVVAHKGAQTNTIIKFLSVFTKHTGVNCNQPVEPAKDWRSDCLAGQNLLVGELCGVL